MITVFWIWLVGVPVTGLLIIFSLGPQCFEKQVSFSEFLIQLLVVFIWAVGWPFVLIGFLWCVHIGITHNQS